MKFRSGLRDSEIGLVSWAAPGVDSPTSLEEQIRRHLTPEGDRYTADVWSDAPGSRCPSFPFHPPSLLFSLLFPFTSFGLCTQPFSVQFSPKVSSLQSIQSSHIQPHRSLTRLKVSLLKRRVYFTWLPRGTRFLFFQVPISKFLLIIFFYFGNHFVP
jgi:hypothetical protein